MNYLQIDMYVRMDEHPRRYQLCKPEMNMIHYSIAWMYTRIHNWIILHVNVNYISAFFWIKHDAVIHWYNSTDNTTFTVHDVQVCNDHGTDTVGNTLTWVTEWLNSELCLNVFYLNLAQYVQFRCSFDQ